MALTSPRFKSSSQLVAASSNAPPLKKGARGRAVHLIQFALIDLGHSMPRSTGGQTSPDGIYGNETVSVVKAFQRSKRLADDGEVGRNTMGAFEAAFPRPGHRVRLHFRSLSLTTLPFEQTLRNAQTVYGQYGIDIRFGSGESLLLTPGQTTLFDRIDQQCKWTLTSGEYDQLHRLGTPSPANELKLFYVNALKDGKRGCGGHVCSMGTTERPPKYPHH